MTTQPSSNCSHCPTQPWKWIGIDEAGPIVRPAGLDRLDALIARPERPTCPEVRPLVALYYDAGNITGGSLHIVLDDGNVDDSSVDFCIGWAQECGDAFGERLARVLRRMTKTQRRKVW